MSVCMYVYMYVCVLYMHLCTHTHKHNTYTYTEAHHTQAHTHSRIQPAPKPQILAHALILPALAPKLRHLIHKAFGQAPIESLLHLLNHHGVPLTRIHTLLIRYKIGRRHL